MELRDTPVDLEFRMTLREWLKQSIATMPCTPQQADWVGRRLYDTEWQRRLFDGGYAGIHWPLAYGGRGASPTEQLIFLEETFHVGAPDIGLNFIGLSHAGPTLIARGSDEQKTEHLPNILHGSEIWCQGFSEPSAGSDLASLRTSAELDGDHYVVSGQKIWTSYAHSADFCELLVRTDSDAPKHKGLTWLILPMGAPGVKVQPLRTVVGSTEFSEMFFDEVRIPAVNRVGEENQGWGVAMVTLEFERGTALLGELLTTSKVLETLISIAKRDGRWDDETIRSGIGHVQAELNVIWALAKRNLSKELGKNDVSGNVFKLAYTRAREHLDKLSGDVLGFQSLTFANEDDRRYDPVEERLRTFMVSIAGGTSQIQRNIVAERGLGMPKGA